MTRQSSLLGALAVVVVLGIVGASAGNLARYTLDVGTTLLLLMAVAQAWNLLAGFSRQFSLGVSAFIGSGAYAGVLAMNHWGVGPVLAMLLGALGSGALGLVLAPALLRLRDDYFTIGSLAAALAVQAWAINSGLVGKSAGLDVPLDAIPDNVELFRLAVAVVAVSSLTTVWFMGSAFGLRMSAVGQDQDAAIGIGVNVRWLRLVSLVLSAVLTGAAGAVIALQQIHIEPTGTLGLSWTINAVLMTIVGGIGTFAGPLIGAALIYLGLTKQLAGNPVLGLVLQGVLLILVIRFAPRGLWPPARDLMMSLLQRLRRRGRPSPPLAAAAEDPQPTPDRPEVARAR